MILFKIITICTIFFVTSCVHKPSQIFIPRPVSIVENDSKIIFNGGQIIEKILTTVDNQLGNEGYQLEVGEKQVIITANTAAGIFYGKQTIKQGLMAGGIKTGLIRDFPRFVWRGAMLDIARHFFGVSEIVRVIDLLSFYKINRLHLHLSDDQGWRIEIKSWPKLTQIGGSTQVGGGVGGFLTQEDYIFIVNYAKQRFITIIPEIDMPGHTNAALASYPEINCDGNAKELYTGIRVGFSSLCMNKDVTYRFIDDVVREIASITPGEYFHIGGDEVDHQDSSSYQEFIPKVEKIVQKYGKSMIGWEEIRKAEISTKSIVQLWLPNKFKKDPKKHELNKDIKIINSFADYAYLDMKYNSNTTLGQKWAAYIDSKVAYDWDPAFGLEESQILGLEAPLWTETIENLADMEYMIFPRIMGYAEIGWSSQNQRNWEEYKNRAGWHGLILDKLRVNYFLDSKIDWR